MSCRTRSTGSRASSCEGLGGAGRAQRREAGLLQQQGQRDQHRAVVVDDEDAGRLRDCWDTCIVVVLLSAYS
jgi:hypothetical protein